MLKLSLAATAVTSVLVTLATGPAVAQTLPPNLPLAIACYAPHHKSWHVGYLYRVQATGDALYMSGNGRLGATLNAKGVVVAPANRPAVLDCFGKTLDELRADGRVMDFQVKR